MRGDKIIEQGKALCIRKPVGKFAEILGNNFEIGQEYPFKKLEKKLGYIEYDVDYEDCDAIVFKQHFLILKKDE